jgi:hypothetical protein
MSGDELLKAKVLELGKWRTAKEALLDGPIKGEAVIQ